MLVVSGIHLLENLKLDELAAKRVHEFAFVVQPLKMQVSRGRRWHLSPLGDGIRLSAFGAGQECVPMCGDPARLWNTFRSSDRDGGSVSRLRR